MVAHRVACGIYPAYAHAPFPIQAWVRDNDLFVTDVASYSEKRVTSDGSKSTINGICDWVYEEEVYMKHNAAWFSPDSSRIAYLKFNESMVPVRFICVFH